jgi:UDP-N-acetyl-D-glucosamine/UDP-N-acetyl-D-galactosamine dehydrogenase
MEFHSVFSKVLIMGLTYKENVPDTRESPVKAMVKELKEFSCDVYGLDPLLNKKEIEHFNVKTIDILKGKVDCIILAVAHDNFKKILFKDLKKIMKDKPVLVDVRRMFNKDEAEKQGFGYYTL